MEKILKNMDKILCALLAAFIAAMLAIGSLQVFCRYILHNSLSWSEELMRYMYVWVTMLGMSMGIRRKGLACISSFVDFVEHKSKVGRYVLAFTGFAFQLALFLLMTVYGTKLCLMSGRQMSPSLPISMGVVYMAMPAGGILALIYTADEILNYIKSVRGGTIE